MQDQFLSNPRVKAVLQDLSWGDRFEEDLASKIGSIQDEEDLSFDQIREELGDLLFQIVFQWVVGHLSLPE